MSVVVDRCSRGCREIGGILTVTFICSFRSLTRRDDLKTNDEIHDRIYYCPVFKALMDTPQMQRLKALKQLATANSTYMNANHTRFEHSLGVAHLAKRMCRRLQERQPKLKITDKDVLCVQLAGLCHDLGHGPFSHEYETLVNKEIKLHLDRNPHLLKHYEGLPAVEPEWRHESASLMMLDAALESLGLGIDMNNLDRPLLQIGDGIKSESMRVYKPSEDEDAKINPDDILTSRDFVFIKECILGKPIGMYPADYDRSGFLGRPYRWQEFLYDIVANRHSGLDVDKIDYFARDDRRCNGGDGNIFVRMIDEAVVARGGCPQPDKCFACTEDNPGKHLMICYPEKMRRNAMDFFKTRFNFHSEIYTHKTTSAVKFMICDILTHADPFFRIPTYMDSDRCFKSDKGLKELPISRAMLHKTSYLRLRDSVIDQIMATTTPELRTSRLIIERLWNHDYYKLAATKPIDLSNPMEAAIWGKSEQDIAKEVLLIKGEHRDWSGASIFLDEEDFVVEKSVIHHGKGTDNPVDFMRFVPDDEKRKLTRSVDDLPIAKTLNGYHGNTPKVMQEQSIRFYCRKGEEKKDLLKHVFELWEDECISEGIVTADYSSDDSDSGEQRESVPLTQEEQSPPASPHRGDYGIDNGEPSPLPMRRRW